MVGQLVCLTLKFLFVRSQDPPLHTILSPLLHCLNYIYQSSFHYYVLSPTYILLQCHTTSSRVSPSARSMHKLHVVVEDAPPWEWSYLIDPDAEDHSIPVWIIICITLLLLFNIIVTVWLLLLFLLFGDMIIIILWWYTKRTDIIILYYTELLWGSLRGVFGVSEWVSLCVEKGRARKIITALQSKFELYGIITLHLHISMFIFLSVFSPPPTSTLSSAASSSPAPSSLLFLCVCYVRTIIIIM